MFATKTRYLPDLVGSVLEPMAVPSVKTVRLAAGILLAASA